MSMSMERFLSFADLLLAEPCMLISRDGLILAANRATESRLGLVPAEITGRRLSEFTADAAGTLTGYLRMCARSRQRLPGSMTFVSRDGQRIVCRCEGAVLEPARKDAPAEVFLRFTAKDAAIAQFQALTQKIQELNTEIGKRKQVEAALREANQQKDVFLATLAHELRNPLAPIRMGLDLLAMEETTPSTTIRLMQKQMDHLVRLVDDLMDVSRVILGKVVLRRQTVALSPLVNQSVAAVQTIVLHRHQGLVISVPDTPIHVDADSVRVVQIIENLLNNASKYTPDGGQIELIAEQANGMAFVTVRDTGVGIHSEVLPRVFDLFTQADCSLDRSEGGLGIGLTLVKQLVEMHGGSVSAHSDGLTQGSTFVVQLPTVEAEVPPELVSGRDSDSAKRRILVVDDNFGATWLLTQLLKKLGDHQVEVAHDGESSLAKIQEMHPDIVLHDIGLPGMDGYEVGRAVRTIPALDDILLIALTGYGREEDRQKAKEAGFDDHLTKPPSIAQMKAVLAHPKLQKLT